MKVSLRWLRDYVDVTVSPEELAARLTMSGTEVGAIYAVGAAWESVVVGQIVGLEPHPNADRLQMATVDLKQERRTVVTGAPNLTVGDKVPFARVGAELIDGHTGEPTKLKRARIRGIASEGMVCSERELGISDSHEGIMILPPEAPLGMPLAEYLGDTILDLKVTPNRPDCLSVIGVAQEVAALTQQAVSLTEVFYEELGPPIEELALVEVADPDLCGRYCASLITDVKLGPSPRWMQDRLIAAGMRPISNIVDITNYVMLEYGQPLHAFDYEQISEKKVIVRRARDGETLVTLDGVERGLTHDMLVIADPEGAIGLAGVMGGAASEVTEETTSILLESANFNPVSIRRTAANLRLRSEASSRFEKGLSAELPPLGLKRATQLMVELAEGKAAKGIIDVYPDRREKEPILLTRERVRRVLGIEPSVDQMMEVLGLLGFKCELIGPAPDLLVTAPYWRTDVRIADDLVEEIARVISYDEIPTTMPGGQLPPQQPDSLLELKERVRDILVGCGMQEVITYSLTSKTMLGKVVSPPISLPPMRVSNPMTLEQEYLRTSMRGSLLAALAANERHEKDAIKLFEVGKVYLPRENDLPEERPMLAGVITGPRFERSWLEGEEKLDFFDAKGVLEILFSRLGIEASFEEAKDQNLVPGRTAQIAIDNTVVGLLGELHPTLAASFDISSQPVYLFEVDLEKLLMFVELRRKYQPLPRFPGISRDIAVVVDAGLESKRVPAIMKSFPLVREVTLFDVYTGEPVPPDKKSLAYSVLFQSPNRTLTEGEVNQTQKEILDRLYQELGATLRG